MFVIHNHVIKSGRLIFYGSCDDGKHVAQRGEHQVGYNFACAGCLVCQQDYPKKTTEQISVKLGTEPLFFFFASFFKIACVFDISVNSSGNNAWILMKEIVKKAFGRCL